MIGYLLENALLKYIVIPFFHQYFSQKPLQIIHILFGGNIGMKEDYFLIVNIPHLHSLEDALKN